MKFLVHLIILLACVMQMHAQSQGGLSVYAGLSAMYNQDAFINPSGHGQYGYLVGADARLNSGDLYFSIGGRYINSSLLPEENMSFFTNDEDYQLAEVRLGFGFNIMNINRHTRLRSKILGSATMAINSPRNRLNIDGYEVINDSWGGITTGLGLDFGPLTADLEYHFGAINAYKDQPESKINTLSFAVGFFF